MRWLVLLLLAVPNLVLADVQAGDVVFQTSRSRQGRVIREVTRSQWTHVGIVLEHQGELQVLEAVQPVRWTPLEQWRRRGVGDRMLVRRPTPTPSAEDLQKMTETGEALVGRDYDARFEWGDERIYCSELVYLVFERALGVRLVEPQRWRELELGPRGRALARRRLGRMPHPDGILVTPAALAASERLATVD